MGHGHLPCYALHLPRACTLSAPVGNFMLLTEAQNSPLKAIDFGLAVFYKPDQLPRTDLGLEGTPWFMAPEVLSSQNYPASDVWAAGVMAYQLLSGR
jgi:calcium-dependent protein kinase